MYWRGIRIPDERNRKTGAERTERRLFGEFELRSVLISTASRSEYGLLEPIIRRCDRSNVLNPTVLKLRPEWSFDEIMRKTKRMLTNIRPDLVLVPCDRREQVPVAMTSFYLNIPTFHFLGGAKGSGTWDDVARHVISCFSHIIFVESLQAKQRLINAGEEGWRCMVTGTTHFDDVDLDDIKDGPSPVNGNYDLLLMNPVTISAERTRKDIKNALSLIDKYTIILPPNEDPFREIVVKECEYYKARHRSAVKLVKQNLNRHMFLKLLSYCSRFISNSSSIVYEAPMFDCEVINPSMRNQERSKISRKWLKGGADRIVRGMSKIELGDSLLKKRLRCYL